MHSTSLLASALLYSSPLTPPTDASVDTLASRPVLTAVRSLAPVEIDGVLSEDVWQRRGDSSFTQRDPDEGKPPTQKTVVWVAYDDAALYVAARLYDTSPDSIISRVGRRDADLSSDWFYFAVDSHHDRRTAFYFGVNPSGSIQDGTFYNDSWDDNSWDGVWQVTARVDAKGWIVECRVPYSQLRFQEKREQVWGVNFMRSIERRKEEDYFVMVPKKESGFVSRFADLVGIRDIKPPARLEILPYAVSSGKFTRQFEKGDPFNDGSILSSNVGADLKIGLGSNMTVNATFNPDFGQVEVDPAVVSDYVNEYQRTTGRLLPTRGNIHGLSGAITHKKDIITLYLQGYLTPAIATKTRHSKEAVDRYIRDFEAVKLVRTITADIEQLSLVTRLSKRVVQQYLDLIPSQETTNAKEP